MRRREFISILGGAAVLWPILAMAQPSARVRHVGILMPYAETDVEYQAHVRALRQELTRLGWTEGVSIQFDERWTTDSMDRVRTDAASLMATEPDVVVAIGGRVIPILRQISSSVPIVVPGAADPIAVGWAESLARPGGNVTGFTFFELSMLGKSIEILKQIAPAIARVGMIYNPANPTTAIFRRMLDASAGPLGIEPMTVPVQGLADIDRALANMTDGPNTGVLFPPDVTIQALRQEVVALVERHRLPAMYQQSVFVKTGGLAFYGADRIDLYRRAAAYVDRILRGEKAGELPFQQPTKYQFMINLKAAKTLDLNPSPTLLALADEVIE
jgi:ABC-type uncharacterized transport system substrate-binding protein